MVLGNDETVNEEGEIIAIELKEGEEEQTLECNSMGLFRLAEGENIMALHTTLRFERTIQGICVLILVVVARPITLYCLM